MAPWNGSQPEYMARVDVRKTQRRFICRTDEHCPRRLRLPGRCLWVNAGNIAEEVAKSITWNAQIFEAWNYGFASKIHAICATMTSFDADILLIATGFKNQDLNELSRSSTDAVAEAYRELYDEGENEEDEDEDDENDHYYESGGGGGGGGHDEEELVDTVVDEPDVNEVS